ncbi:hypothetical protein JG731_03215 [Chlamydia gallinacea]|uniref:Rubrerythrin family protein n=2 Tax=Chlamydia gallinacea TaxID=1457153 RepID=A0A173DY02_9CHLA|nr:hypothetical protein [Chlamydia gallinacea]EYE60881.1 hypothetical protein M127_5740 [Bacteroides fragilis str. S6L5]ANG65801.1 hypothetical protein M787_000460 [Chlamydia gallinacea 08-1274/3]AQT77140.1 hypothetical protein B1F83_00395 [Chlamydia gallinacea]MBX6680357.1 hypothetical protein [Chlamydia gallinacea]MBX6687521.1 hypothetical protein [Chlamydia gallinacea]
MFRTQVTTFISYAPRWERLLKHIVASSNTHSKWINTLSFLENCGAKKISASEHPTQVKKEVLKHAAEEFRHAFYLKKQISRITSEPFLDYSLDSVLGGNIAKYYLHLLDLRISKLLKTHYHINNQRLKTTAYILVTSAIEMRAFEVYPIYHRVLQNVESTITIKSIILEEQEHLEEMEAELSTLPHANELLSQACAFESSLCLQFINHLEKSLLQTENLFKVSQ